MLKKIDHVGILVASIPEALKFYQGVLGLSVSGIEEVKREGVRIAFLPVGESKIELLEPLDKESPLYRILEKRGEGLHHLAFETDSTVDCLKGISAFGVMPINGVRQGADGKEVAFLHPKQTHGVLVEFCSRGERV
ncbi:MAG: methylmalonyl-CoA epimerase [Firmicutes bacterium]|nr:methylmalonyl-CoA epimerase [Bacillota bacterium]